MENTVSISEYNALKAKYDALRERVAFMVFETHVNDHEGDESKTIEYLDRLDDVHIINQQVKANSTVKLSYLNANNFYNRHITRFLNFIPNVAVTL